jgi:cytochrome c-type biogenesis protein CcsB
VAWNPESKSEVFLSKGVRLFVTVPDLGRLLLLTTLVVASPLVCYGLAHWKKNDSLLTFANRAVFLSILLQVMTLVMFLVRANDGRYPSLDADGLFPTSLAASPFILSGLVGGVFISLLYLLLLWRRPDLGRLLPSADNLDRITYKTICLAFPLLTLMIAAGAYWANQTWGSYWSWDPKETWAAITWLVYALYLHMRITRGWRGRRAAYFAIAGFAVVMFTFFGVTYLLPGLHAYA